MKHHDVIVVGLGAMGSAALYSLAKEGLSVLGLDTFSPPHDHGSSHGESRIIRRANGEGAAYQPLIKRAFDLWAALEQASGETLFHPSGGLVIAPETGGSGFHGHAGFVELSAHIAEQHGVEHRRLDWQEIKDYAPMLKVTTGDHAYYEPGGGILRPEACIRNQLRLAGAQGAQLQTDEKVLEYSFDSSGVTVKTVKGNYQADRVILAAGAWMKAFMPPAQQALLEVCSQKIFWFEVENLAAFHHTSFPFCIWTKQAREDFICAFPVADGGTPALKMMTEQYVTRSATPLSSPISKKEQQAFYRDFVTPNIEGVTSNCLKASSCHYTVTPDEHFILDLHPETDRVVLASPCSGHGFKFSAAIGEVLGELATTGKSTLDIEAFRLKRFKASSLAVQPTL